MGSRGSGQRTGLRSMSAIWWNGQNHRVAAPAATAVGSSTTMVSPRFRDSTTAASAAA
jgi:hypothetical protein